MGNEYARVDVLDTNYLLREANGSLYVFDAGGRLTRIEDRHGNAILLGYDGELLTSVQDAGSGRTLTFAYTAGKLAAVTGTATPKNFSGILVAFSYTSGNLTGVIHPDGESFLYLYTDPKDPHNLTGKTKGDGVTVLNEVSYDSRDRAVRSVLHGGSEAASLTYGPWETTVTDSLGRTKVYRYDVIEGIAVPLEVEDGGADGGACLPDLSPCEQVGGVACCDGGPCDLADDGGFVCNPPPPICPAAGEACSPTSPCCPGLTCIDGAYNPCTAGPCSCTFAG